MIDGSAVFAPRSSSSAILATISSQSAIVAGRQDFVAFWRTLPWDHAPGALLVREAGGVVRRFDGSDYAVGDDRAGLLAAANDDIWHTVRSALLPA